MPALEAGLEALALGATTREAAAKAGVSKWHHSFKGISQRHKRGGCIEYEGRRYYRNKKGYWHTRVRVDGRQVQTYLHREVWAKANGPIPDGYHVHHKDRDPGNWALDNLELVHGQAHNSYHRGGYGA